MSWTRSKSPSAWREGAQGAEAERQRLGERPGRELQHLEEVLARLDLPVGGEAAGIVVVEQVEAGQLVQLDALVEHRVGLAAEHLDVVAEVDERLGEVAGVDALAADVRLAAVRQVGDAQRLVAGGGHRTRLPVPCYPPVTGRPLDRTRSGRPAIQVPIRAARGPVYRRLAAQSPIRTGPLDFVGRSRCVRRLKRDERQRRPATRRGRLVADGQRRSSSPSIGRCRAISTSSTACSASPPRPAARLERCSSRTSTTTSTSSSISSVWPLAGAATTSLLR